MVDVVTEYDLNDKSDELRMYTDNKSSELRSEIEVMLDVIDENIKVLQKSLKNINTYLTNNSKRNPIVFGG